MVGEQPAAEHGIAVDRFAREIVRFLSDLWARLRQLNARPLGCPCATVSCVALAFAKPSRRALSCPKARRTCSERRNAIASCPLCAKRHHPCLARLSATASCALACEMSPRMPIWSQRQGAMPTRVRNIVAHADLVATPWRHARSRVEPRRACPSRANALAACPLACGTSSCMPISPERSRSMLSRVRNVILNNAGSPTSACS